MPTYTLLAQDVNGDPSTFGNDIKIVTGAISSLSFEDADGNLGDVQPGDTVSVDGGPPQTYEVLGVGDVRGDTQQRAVFIRLADGTTFAIDLNADSDEEANLQNGNTGLTTNELEDAGDLMFPVPPDPICFTPGTMLLGRNGPVAVEALKAGDLLQTCDNGLMPIRWVGRQRFRFSKAPHKHKPVLISAGSLGRGLPHRDIVVSPQHRMCLSGPEVERMFGVQEVLALSKGLTGLRGVRRMNGKRSIDYISVMMERHEILVAEGAPSESFFPGPTALTMVGERLKEEILTEVPALRTDPTGGYGEPARRVLKFREAVELCRRVRAGGDPLLTLPRRFVEAVA